MDLQGKVIAALPARSGTSARGEWKAQDFVIETHENYPHKMVFSVFGEERLHRLLLQVLRLHSLHSRMLKVKVQMICHSKENRFY